VRLRLFWRAINYALTASANFLQQLVVAKVAMGLPDLSFITFVRIRVIRVWLIIRLRRGYGGRVETSL
jgi:hypothetical protein